MNRRITLLLSIVTFLFLAVEIVHGFTRQPEEPRINLIAVALPDDGSLERFKETGLPAYGLMRGEDGGYVIAGASQDEIVLLRSMGLSYSALDAYPQQKQYYIAAAAPVGQTPEWTSLGKVLLNTGSQVLLEITDAAPDSLLSSGARVQRMFMEPMVLNQTFPEELFAVEIAFDPLVESMMEQVYSSTLYKYVGDLSGAWPAFIDDMPYTIQTRHTYSGVPIAKAVAYVTQHLEGTGMDIEHHVWDAAKPPNVIGEITGEVVPEDIYLITAHLDSTARPPANYLLTAPGADDNASGSTGVMVAATIFSQYRWSCTLRFAFFTGEEQGLYGSDAYADRALADGENILGVLNMDMIGFNSDSVRAIDLEYAGSVAPSQDLAFMFGDVIDTYSIDLVPGYDSTTCCSDHVPFLLNGFPAILVIEDFNDFNDYYHTTDDLLKNLDMGYFTDLLKASVGTFAHMSNCMLTGSLEGHVRSAADNSPIDGAIISYESTLGLQAATSANGSGYYTLTNSIGTYTVTASAPGFAPVKIGGVEIISGTITTLDFALSTQLPVGYLPVVKASNSGSMALLLPEGLFERLITP